LDYISIAFSIKTELTGPIVVVKPIINHDWYNLWLNVIEWIFSNLWKA